MREPADLVGPDEVVSAVVLLRAADGRAPDAGAPVTRASLAEWLPGEGAAAAAAALRAAGFEVGEVVGNTFALTAPAERFARQFGVQLVRTDAGAVRAVAADGTVHAELRAERLPEPARPHVASVVFADPATYF